MKVLIVEDDAQVSNYIRKGLEEENHAADVAAHGKKGLLLATTEKYDAIIMDRMLPELDGLTILKSIRAAGNLTPVLILSALGEVDDKVKGLRAGGDDYLVKPFAFPELMARLEVMCRRAQPQAAESRLTAQGIEVDLLSRRVLRDGKLIDLQTREYQLLEYLMRNKGRVVTRAMLLENVWEYHFDPQTNVIDVHISRLRRKLDQNADNPVIKTIRGAGYLIEE